MSNDYKASKEAFVSGMTGSTVFHINMISGVALSSIALHSALRSRVQAFGSAYFLAEFVILAMPLLLSMTLFAEAPGALSLLLLVPMLVLLLLPPLERGTPLPAESRDELASPNARSRAETPQTHSSPSLRPLPALTTYRAHMMLMTILSILAVDFQVFPRVLAKCETFGISLMDIGVGSFVFSQGVVSAIPIIKDITYLQAPIVPKLKSVSRKMIPIIVLGILRVVLVKGTEYPEHVTEYGVHWNFFVTLALLPIIEVLLHPIILHIPVGLLGLWIGVLHQFALSSGGMKDFILNAPRSNIIYANKEGLLSLLGYVSIHILGLSLGTVMLPPSPSFFRKQQQQLLDGPSSHRPSKLDPSAPRQNAKIVIELLSYSVVWWMLLAFVRLGLEVSRRMANISYVLWVAAYNTSFILGYILLDMVFFPTRTSKIRDPTDPSGKRLLIEEKGSTSSAPALLEAINKNAFILFLLSNVATGLINLNIQTMFVGNMKAMGILCAYSLGMCVFAWLCRRKRLWKM
ncbi:GWT1-domain-containing protein [Suillus clintonianus]|uniref:GWT1-domain-containing protein n=1 Tax=Suillus clintonianus TaxID=1904413 RepID=UPI001B866B6E|nr:GWT1-domain-containing protein [Suillus clintonianus]KAG2138382.1 GWT1-domain-containing protein [Suillus clintonianus]